MARLLSGLTLIVCGLAVLGLVASSLHHSRADYALTLRPADEATLRAIAPLTRALPTPENFSVENITITTPDLRAPTATGIVVRHDDKLVPLAWRNNVTEPVFFTDLAAADLAQVMDALRQHAPRDAVIFAWWDLSRAIRLLTQHDAPLDDPQAQGLLLPAPWEDARRREGERWGAGVAPETAKPFQRFIDALLANATDGAKIIRDIARGKPAYIIVHISDVGKLAATRPQELSIGHRDFPASGVSHGVIRSAKQWLKDANMTGPFAAEPIDGALRLHYFPNSTDSARLITKLLPFSTSNPAEPDGFALVYQFRGYWVYRVKR